jgi:hypothetical protein
MNYMDLQGLSKEDLIDKILQLAEKLKRIQNGTKSN